MSNGPGALDKLYSMLHDADALELTHPARMRLIGAIGSLETEALERFRSDLAAHGHPGPRGASSAAEPRAVAPGGGGQYDI
jgi:hypothetical protein